MADVLLQDGDLPVEPTLTTSRQLVPQRVAVRLRLSEGEWPFDESVGLPWIEWFQDKSLDAQDIAPIIRSEIAETRGVEEVTSFSVTDSGSSWSFTAEVIVGSGESVQLDLSFKLQPDDVHPLQLVINRCD